MESRECESIQVKKPHDPLALSEWSESSQKEVTKNNCRKTVGDYYERFLLLFSYLHIKKTRGLKIKRDPIATTQDVWLFSF